MKILTLLFAIALTIVASLQVAAQTTGAAINTSGATADPSAMLDVSSTTSGVLIPRMTEIERTNIFSPARGLLVYQIDATEGFWYFDGTAWSQLGGGGSGGGGISCSSPADGKTVRYDGVSGQYECTDMIEIMKGGYKNYASIGNNASPSPYFSLWIRDRDTISFPPDPTIYYQDVTRVGIGYNPSTTYGISFSVDGGTHIDDGLRVGTTTSPPSKGILSYGDIKTTYGDVITSTSGAYYHGTYKGVSTTVGYVTGVSVMSATLWVNCNGASATYGHMQRTLVTRVTATERTLTIKGGIITGI